MKKSVIDLYVNNIRETEKLLNYSISTYQDMARAAYDILSLGAKNVVITGGHILDPIFSQDYWTDGHESFWLASKRVPHKKHHGANGVLASAIIHCLSGGYSIKDAIVIAKMHINKCIRLTNLAGNHFAIFSDQNWPEEECDLPYLSYEPLNEFPKAFRQIVMPLGLYPVVENASWVERLLNIGVKTIQLRIKGGGKNVETEIQKSVDIANQYGAQLYINDYWALAIQCGAQGIHLGQEDLQHADIDKIYCSGLNLGLSSHGYAEVAYAHRFNPSYIACGPIFSTTSKVVAAEPQGVEQLKRWRRTLHYPLVAIGGINLERLQAILSTGIEGVALISAITHADDPISTTRKFLTLIEQFNR